MLNMGFTMLTFFIMCLIAQPNYMIALYPHTFSIWFVHLLVLDFHQVVPSDGVLIFWRPHVCIRLQNIKLDKPNRIYLPLTLPLDLLWLAKVLYLSWPAVTEHSCSQMHPYLGLGYLECWWSGPSVWWHPALFADCHDLAVLALACRHLASH